MAKYLYRLGSFAARRAWIVVIAWVMILGIAGGAAATLRQPFTSKLTIPGTEFQTVIDDLQQSSPEAAHGSGTVVFSTADGTPFTAEQKKAVQQTVKAWSTVDGVDDAANPFDTQADLDDARAKISDGKDKLDDAETEIAENEKKLADGKDDVNEGKKTLEANAAKLADGEKELAAGQAKITSGQQEIDTNVAKLTHGQDEIDAGKAKLAKGKKQIAAARKTVTAGQQKLDKAKVELTNGQQKLDAAEAEIDEGKKQIADARSEVKNGQTELDSATERADALSEEKGDGAPDVVAARAEIAGQQATLDATSKTLDEKAANLSAGEKTLATKQSELTTGGKTLAANQRKLSSAAATLKQKSAEITKGERQLAAAQRKLDNGKEQLADGQAKLDEGQSTIDANRVELADGKQQISDGRDKLDEAADKIADGEDKLADGKTTLSEKKVELERGERQLALMDGLRAVSKDGATAVTSISFEVPLNEVSDETKEAIPAKASELAGVGVDADYSSDVSPTPAAGGTTEMMGVGIAAVVLLVMLGSLLAAGLPLIIAMVGVGTGLLSVLALTHWVTMTDVTPVLALMLGLAVGIDYALFLVHRHRQQLAQGVELRESIARATGTAGGAVLFAGLTVVVALSALILTGIPFLGVMGLAAAGTVAVAILVALTLTPALLRLIGPRVLSRRGRRKLAAAQAEEEAAAVSEDAAAQQPIGGSARGRGWGGLVTRHPVITSVATIIVLGLLAIPAASLKLGLPDGSAEAHDTSAYRAYTKVTDAFGAGQNAAIIGVATLDEDEARGLSDDQATDLQLDIAEQLKQTADVEYVVPASVSDDHRTMVFQIIPKTGPNDDATIALVHQLRADRQMIIDDTAVDSLGYAGQTVANIDISDRLAEVLPLYLSVVVGISVVLLLLVFRSVVVPLLATGGFLLSIAASFGAVVAVYQWGWFGSVFGVEQPGLILGFLPTLAIGILFGLAMDYQMFLVSGMREAWSHGHTARTAVRTGFSHGATVVTAAALIMTSVFASFIFADQTMIKPIGFALAAGVLIDAFVIRMTLMPALMHLLGEKAWYLPRWLDKILPDLDVEGSRLAAAQERPSRPTGSASTGAAAVGTA